MLRRMTYVCVAGLVLATSVKAQGRTNIMYERVVPGGPTYGQFVEQFFAQTVFPKELSYNGVGIKRDNVIAERVETNGRGGYWISVRARYSGKAGVIPVPVAERARVHYDNGGIRVDLGGLKGVLNTRGIGNWIKTKFPKKKGEGKPGGNGPTNATVSFHYTLQNKSGRTVHFRLPSGKEYVLKNNEKGSYKFTGNPSKATIVVRETGKSYGLKDGNHRFHWMSDKKRIGLDIQGR